MRAQQLGLPACRRDILKLAERASLLLQSLPLDEMVKSLGTDYNSIVKRSDSTYRRFVRIHLGAWLSFGQPR